MDVGSEPVVAGGPSSLYAIILFLPTLQNRARIRLENEISACGIVFDSITEFSSLNTTIAILSMKYPGLPICLVTSTSSLYPDIFQLDIEKILIYSDTITLPVEHPSVCFVTSSLSDIRRAISWILAGGSFNLTLPKGFRAAPDFDTIRTRINSQRDAAVYARAKNAAIATKNPMSQLILASVKTEFDLAPERLTMPSFSPINVVNGCFPYFENASTRCPISNASSGAECIDNTVLEDEAQHVVQDLFKRNSYRQY